VELWRKKAKSVSSQFLSQKSYSLEKGKVSLSLSLWLSSSEGMVAPAIGSVCRGGLMPRAAFKTFPVAFPPPFTLEQTISCKCSTWNLLQLASPVLRTEKLLHVFESAFLNALPGA